MVRWRSIGRKFDLKKHCFGAGAWALTIINMELSAARVCVTHCGERLFFVDLEERMVREQFRSFEDNDHVLILHMEKRVIRSSARSGVKVPDGYRLEIDPHIADQFLETDRPCDCTSCKNWCWSVISHARGTMADMIVQIQEEHPDFEQSQIIQACQRAMEAF